jgi:hypothetical protein
MASPTLKVDIERGTDFQQVLNLASSPEVPESPNTKVPAKFEQRSPVSSAMTSLPPTSATLNSPGDTRIVVPTTIGNVKKGLDTTEKDKIRQESYEKVKLCLYFSRAWWPYK